MDKSLNITVWNERTVRLTEFEKEEALGQNLVEKFIDDASKASVREVLVRALVEGKNAENYELPLFTKKGERRDILLSATAIREPDGTISGVIGVGQDLTDFKAEQMKQKATADELSGLIENANAPIIRVDKELNITVWNERTARLTQFSKQEAIGQNLVEKFIDEDSRASVREVLRKALIYGENTENYELPLFTKQGKRRDMLLSAT